MLGTQRRRGRLTPPPEKGKRIKACLQAGKKGVYRRLLFNNNAKPPNVSNPKLAGSGTEATRNPRLLLSTYGLLPLRAEDAR
jgi:hypothetical protein